MGWPASDSRGAEANGRCSTRSKPRRFETPATLKRNGGSWVQQPPRQCRPPGGSPPLGRSRVGTRGLPSFRPCGRPLGSAPMMGRPKPRVESPLAVGRGAAELRRRMPQRAPPHRSLLRGARGRAPSRAVNRFAALSVALGDVLDDDRWTQAKCRLRSTCGGHAQDHG